MAVQWIREIHAGRKTKGTSEFQREYTRVFKILTNNPYDDGAVALNALASGSFVDRNGVAQVCFRGAVHPVDPQARCRSVEAVNSSEDRLEWLATCEYSTQLQVWEPSPTERPTVYDHSTESIEKALPKDLDGKPIVNSAYETFEQPATQDIGVGVIKATCTRVGYSKSLDLAPFFRHVNGTGWTIDGQYFPPGQAIFWDLNVGMQDELGVYYRKFDYTFKTRDDEFTTTETTIDVPTVGAGVNVVIPLASVAGIVVGQELVLPIGLGTESVIVTAVDPALSEITVARLLHSYGGGTVVTIKTYTAWDYMPLDMGFSEWDHDNDRAKPIMLSGGQPPQVPVLLDGEGNRLEIWEDEDPVRLHFRTRERADFSTIVFP